MENTQRKCPFLIQANSFVGECTPGTDLTVDMMQRFGSMGVREGGSPRIVRCESCLNKLVMRVDMAPDPDTWPTIGTISSLALESTACLRQPNAAS